MYRRVSKTGIRYNLKQYCNLKSNFTQIPNDAMKIIEKATTYRIYCYLCCRYNNDNKYAFPSLSTIAKETKLSKQTVVNAIKELEDLGLVKTLKFEKQTTTWVNNCYIIFYPIIQEEEKIVDLPQFTEEQLKEIRDIENKIYYFEIENKEDEEDDYREN